MSLAKPMPVKLFLGPTEEKTLTINVPPLYLGAKLEEYTAGATHDVTDRLFVVRRAYRVNDSLPSEPASQPRWLWQRGGWLLVDCVSGRITQIKLADFDPYYSDVSWYRDYVAYCSLADDGERVSAVVAQIRARKPLYRSSLRSWEANSLIRSASRQRGSANQHASPSSPTAARSRQSRSLAALPT